MNLKFWKKDVQPTEKKSYNLSAGGGWEAYFSKERKNLKSWKTTWAKTGLNIRAENLAKANVLMYQKKGKESIEVVDSPFLDIVKGTNSFQQSWYELMYLITLSLDVYGKGFLYAVSGVKGIPAEFVFLPPSKMTIALNKQKGAIDHYEYSNDGSITKFAPEEIIFFKLPSLDGILDYEPTIKALENIVEIDNIQNFFQKKFTLTGGNINEIISSEVEISDEEIERLESVLRERQELENDSTWLILQQMKYEKVKTSAKDLDFINGKIATRDEILSKLRVPKILAGLGQNSNRATAMSELWSFVYNVIEPFSKFIVNKLNIFIAENYGEEFYINFEWKLREDENNLLELFKAGALAESEIRNQFGFQSEKPAK